MGQIAQEARADRVPIGAFVDREQRDELVRLARERLLHEQDRAPRDRRRA